MRGAQSDGFMAALRVVSAIAIVRHQPIEPPRRSGPCAMPIAWRSGTLKKHLMLRQNRIILSLNVRLYPRLSLGWPWHLIFKVGPDEQRAA